ncbi:hypothetical protein FB475_5592, partial [Kribbella jejuensis]
ALRHRFPLTWARIQAGEATPWKARQIVRACTKLDHAAAEYVDRRVAAIIDTISPYRLEKITQAAKQYADPQRAADETAEAADDRGVYVGRGDKHGNKTIYIKAPAAAVNRHDTAITNIAEALKALGDTRPLQHRRAEAVGILPDPRFTQELLTQAHQTPIQPPLTEPAPTESAAARPAPAEPAPAAQASSEPGPGGPGPDWPAPSWPASTEPPSTGPVPAGSVPARPTATAPAPAGAASTRPLPAGPGPTRPAPAGPTAAALAPAGPAPTEAASTGAAAAGAASPGPVPTGATFAGLARGRPAPARLAAGGPASGGDASGGLGFSGAAAGRGAAGGLLEQFGPPDDEWLEAAGPEDREPVSDPFDARVGGLDPRRDPAEGAPMTPAALQALRARLAQVKQDAYREPSRRGRRDGADNGQIRPGKTEVVVHLTDHTLATGTGVLRAEGIGPLLAAQLSELIGHGPYVVKPVIDLNDAVSVNAYEIPTRIRERVKLIHPVELFPYGTRETTNTIDLDHIEPYDPLGPPGQTSTANLAPLGRFGHRVKTHARGWSVRRVDDRTIEWTTPHGFRFRVDPNGTHRVDPRIDQTAVHSSVRRTNAATDDP